MEEKLKAEQSFVWRLGPDNIHPARSYTTCKLDEAVKLRLDNHPLKMNREQYNLNFKPISIFTKFKNTVELGSDNIALGILLNLKSAFTLNYSDLKKVTNNNGIVNKISYGDYWKLCTKASKSFI